MVSPHVVSLALVVVCLLSLLVTSLASLVAYRLLILILPPPLLV